MTKKARRRRVIVRVIEESILSGILAGALFAFLAVMQMFGV